VSASAIPLSAFDDSFLTVESPTAHMHVGWAALFEPPAGRPRPGFEELRAHIGARLSRAPRYRQRLSSAPLDLDAPCWVDDRDFRLERHVTRATSNDLDEAAAECMSEQLDRERPLWELRVADRLADGRIGVIGKAHHCMVDGIAAVELASLLLDPSPDAVGEADEEWQPEEEPDTATRLAAIAQARAREQIELARAASGFLLSPRRLLGAANSAAEAALGALNRTLRPATPVAPLNEPISPARRLARASRPLADLQRVRERFRATVNDVYLAAAAGALRRLLQERGQDPVPLKTMVPVSVREDDGLEPLGNRISFMFVDLPCEEPDPERRLRRVQMAAAESKESGDPGAAELALRLIGYGPRTLRHLVARAMASPRMFNLVVSNIPGPREPMYMRGCELKEAYPVVPLADGHALSIGMTTIQDRACFGLYADRALGDVDRVAEALEESTDELLALA
jgi:diacylglycerol O-acyltransferase / wax synthase